MIGGYGAGPSAVLDWSGPTNTFSPIIGLADSAQDVVIQDLDFQSPSPVSLTIVRGIAPNGNNLTVRNCFFGNLSYAFNCERIVNGLPEERLAFTQRISALFASFVSFVTFA